MRVTRCIPPLIILAFFVLPASAQTPPAWLRDAARLAVPDYPPETEIVILVDEQETTVNPKGVMITAGRHAHKVLRESGIVEAGRLAMVSAYDTKIRDMIIWRLRPGKDPVKVTMKKVVESGLAPDTLYTDLSLKMLMVPDVEVGDVVGCAWEVERMPASLEDVFQFQSRHPLVKARYAMNLPPGWNVEASWVNWTPRDGQTAAAASSPRAWTITDVPAVDDEPLMPGRDIVSGRLVLRLKAPGNDPRCFAGWSEVGAWYLALTKGCRAPDGSVSDKAARLVQGTADTFSGLRALAEFVQKEIRYVAIEIGVGGYQPHLAPSVLANRYGDCKDKATLLAVMLQSRDIASYYVLVHTTRRTVAADTPVTLYGFNHVVLAIRLPADVAGTAFPAAVDHPRLGRLLVFDPTSSYAPLGRLPSYLQGNTGLLVTEDGGELLPLPMPAPEANLLDRHGHFILAADGTLEGEIHETRRGTIADQTRGALRDATDMDRTKYMETFLADSLAGCVLQSNEFKNLNDNAGDLTLAYRFKVPRYAKAAGGMMVVRPRIVGRKSAQLETAEAKPRRYPIDLDGTCLQRDEFVIELTEGCRVEGLPPATDIDAGFAVYKSKTEESGRAVVYRREYRLLKPELPAALYGEVVRFFRAMDADERQSILLKK